MDLKKLMERNFTNMYKQVNVKDVEHDDIHWEDEKHQISQMRNFIEMMLREAVMALKDKNWLEQMIHHRTHQNKNRKIILKDKKWL